MKRTHKQIVSEYMSQPHQLIIQNNINNMLQMYSKELLIQSLVDMGIFTVVKKKKKAA